MSKVLAGRYELLERIGEGGMSVVYKAKDKLLNRFVAIKILKPEFINDHKFIDSFRRESQAAASMSHPNIVNIYDVGKEGNIHYIVMELVEGSALSDIIRDEGPMPYTKVIAISKQIASALAFAHKTHIIHRDVKPHNIMMTPSGTAKITDFGIAKAVNAATIVDNTDGIIGSVHYFSPEQARGGYVDEKSDIYSLGIVMYEMLTGNVPFDGDNPVNIALMHINGEMPRPSQVVDGVPPALEHIIMKCTDKYPVNRYASADELIEALNNLEFVGSVVGDSVLMGTEHEPNRNIERAVSEAGYDEEEDEYYESEEKGRSGRKKKVIIIIAVALAVIAAGLAVSFAMGLFGGKEIEAPDFTEMTLTEALTEAEKHDVKIKEGKPVISEDVEKGKIVSQSPEPGDKMKTKETVTVYVSAGPGDGTVPDVEGLQESAARDAIESAGFRVGDVTSQDSTEEKGEVIGQDPKAGDEAEKGSAVNLVLSNGSLAKTTMPYLIGKSLSEAESLLKKNNLDVGSVTREYSDTASEGEVIGQEYDQGEKLERNTSVGITVSLGPEPTTTTAPTTKPKPTTQPTTPLDEEEIDEEAVIRYFIQY